MTCDSLVGFSFHEISPDGQDWAGSLFETETWRKPLPSTGLYLLHVD